MLYIRRDPKTGDFNARRVPNVGERVDVEGFGRATVKSSYHNENGNFLRLTFDDVLTNERTFLIPFEVR